MFCLPISSGRSLIAQQKISHYFMLNIFSFKVPENHIGHLCQWCAPCTKVTEAGSQDKSMVTERVHCGVGSYFQGKKVIVS